MKASGGLLYINARAFKANTEGLCTVCNLDASENTEHFVAICPLFKRIRSRYFGYEMLSNEQLLEILNGKDFCSLFNFLTDALKYRDLLLNEFS